MSNSSNYYLHPGACEGYPPFAHVVMQFLHIGEAVAESITAISRGIVRAVRHLYARHLMRNTMSELRRLDDRLLRDVGLTRADIPRVARDCVDVSYFVS